MTWCHVNLVRWRFPGEVGPFRVSLAGLTAVREFFVCEHSVSIASLAPVAAYNPPWRSTHSAVLEWSILSSRLLIDSIAYSAESSLVKKV
jgi:hypothetical protein